MRASRLFGVAPFLLVWLFGIAAAAGPEKASAADKAIAHQAFTEGTRRYNLGEYEAALEQFKTAYLHFEDPAFLFNIAQCQRALGHKQEALVLYRSFLRQATVPEGLRKNVNDIIDQLESAVAAEKAEEDRRAKEAQTVPPVAEQQPAAVVVQAAPQHEEKKPVYKKWWLWTAVGGVVVAGVVIGLAVGLTRTPASPTAPSGYQTLQPAF
jgi:tetratricopeptide (TPR) repeat protein